MTSLLPSDRLVVPSRLDLAPFPALAFPEVSSGGQAAAQVPEQVDLVEVSATKR